MHCLCSYIYLSVRVSVHNSVNSSLRFIFTISPVSLHIPYSKGMRRVGGHSKRLITQFKVSFIEQKSS